MESSFCTHSSLIKLPYIEYSTTTDEMTWDMHFSLSDIYKINELP